VGAAVGDLEDVAPGFAGWSDNVAVVTHLNISLVSACAAIVALVGGQTARFLDEFL
jgi:hypothetical protein